MRAKRRKCRWGKLARPSGRRVCKLKPKSKLKGKRRTTRRSKSRGGRGGLLPYDSRPYDVVYQEVLDRMNRGHDSFEQRPDGSLYSEKI